MRDALEAFNQYVEGGAMATRQAARAEIVVAATPDEAFRMFTDEIGLWWRQNTRYSNDPDRALYLRIESHVGGRFVEV